MKSTQRATSRRSNATSQSEVSLRWPRWFVPLVIAAVTLAAFFPSLSNDFVNWDDDKTLYDNPFYRGLAWPQIKWMFTTFLMGHYQPLSWLTFAFDYSLWGMNPVGYHLTNLLLHMANGVLFYFVTRRLLVAALAIPPSAENWRLDLSAGLAALLFAIHPLRVESVAWATERRDVLSGLFYFATIYFYLRLVECSKFSTRRRWLCATLAIYFLSLLSKATAITLPFILLVLDVYPLKRLTGRPGQWFKRESRGVLGEKLPFLILALAFAVAALLAQQVTGALKPLEQFGIASRLLQAGYAFMFYLGKTLWPVSLAPIYELPVDVGSWFWLFVFCGVGTIALTMALFFFKRRWPALLACWVYYLVVLAPVTGVAQSGPQLVADRYSYLACLGWPLLIAGGFYRLSPQESFNRQRYFFSSGFAIMVVFSLAILTWNQTKIWRSPIALWQHGTAVEPLASIAHYNLGRAYERENNLAPAIESYRRAATVNPSYAKAHFNLARLLALKGDEAQALAHYRRVIEIRPDHADAHNDLGLLLELKGEDTAAVVEFHRAMEIEPAHGRALFNLAELLARQSDLAKAIVMYERAARSEPNQAAIQVRWAIALARQGQLASATEHFRRALELQPNDSDAHVLMARSLAAQGNKDEAESHYRQALRLMKAAGKSSGSELRELK
ncbi:MAG: tetratricopeptide repeat protein [Deltaproteobacteria bacterium]|nr:tetratricopeptide repeat protein [Deltaproteobacteria bacterium]